MGEISTPPLPHLDDEDESFNSKFCWGSDILALKTAGDGNPHIHLTSSHVCTQ